jgi:hypothetical protein
MVLLAFYRTSWSVSLLDSTEPRTGFRTESRNESTNPERTRITHPCFRNGQAEPNPRICFHAKTFRIKKTDSYTVPISEDTSAISSLSWLISTSNSCFRLRRKKLDEKEHLIYTVISIEGNTDNLKIKRQEICHNFYLIKKSFTLIFPKHLPVQGFRWIGAFLNGLAIVQ